MSSITEAAARPVQAAVVPAGESMTMPVKLSAAGAPPQAQASSIAVLKQAVQSVARPPPAAAAASAQGALADGSTQVQPAARGPAGGSIRRPRPVGSPDTKGRMGLAPRATASQPAAAGSPGASPAVKAALMGSPSMGLHRMPTGGRAALPPPHGASASRVPHMVSPVHERGHRLGGSALSAGRGVPPISCAAALAVDDGVARTLALE